MDEKMSRSNFGKFCVVVIADDTGVVEMTRVRLKSSSEDAGGGA